MRYDTIRLDASEARHYAPPAQRGQRRCPDDAARSVGTSGCPDDAACVEYSVGCGKTRPNCGERAPAMIPEGDAGGSPAERAGRQLLQMRSIGKSFPGVRVLDQVGFDLLSGEVHFLAGENGAGKSTLIKILCGVHAEYDGEIFLDGERATFRSPHDAARRGISVIHQEMSLIDSMTVVDNIFLGREETRGGIWMRRGSERRKAERLLRQLGMDVDLARSAEEYPVSVRQMLEIAKALAFDARIIVMDEPTSALSDPEVERLFDIIAGLKRRGCGIIYISHRMEEIYRIADRITVLRDGRHVGTARAAELARNELVRWMVGREISQQFPERSRDLGEERLRVESFFVPDRSGAKRWAVEDVSLCARAGEILGVAGLQGSGNSELFCGLFGAYGALVRGKVFLDGEPVRLRSPRHSIERGVALLTDDRKGNGLVLGMNVVHNVTLASIEAFSPRCWLRPRREEEAAARQTSTLGIGLASLGQDVSELSGGNQQKVVLGKWLEIGPKVLLLDEPTRGVDVGAKHDIYELMNKWTREGITILLITSEMPELLAMSDRIMVMHRGRVTAEFPREEASQERVLRAAMGEN